MRTELFLLTYFLLETCHYADDNYPIDSGNYYDNRRDHLNTYSPGWEAMEKVQLYSTAELCPDDTPWDQKSWDPFRIQWERMKTAQIPDETMVVVTDVLNKTLKDFEQLMEVQRSNYPIGLKLAEDCWGAGKDFPQHVLKGMCDLNDSGGIRDVDFMIYVNSRGKCSTSLLASAAPCRTLHNGRPIFGIISLCAENLRLENWNRLALTKTLQHELFHALGFTGSSIREYLKYVDNGTEKKGIEEFVRKWKINSNETREHKALLITTPKVKDFVRNHFNCPDLEGAELENEGESTTRHQHWEKRIFGGEILTGYISRRSYISTLTLKFFEDTGWYKPNYSLAEPFYFGKGAGCVFAKGSCRDYMDTKKELMNVPAAAKPYCNWADYVLKKTIKSTTRECSEDRHYYSQCDWNEVEDKDVDENKAYFADQSATIDGVNITGRNVYGGLEVLDGCPQWSEYMYGSGQRRVGDSVCINAYSQPRADGNFGAELFGDDSICLKQDGKFEVYECLRFGISLYHTERGQHGAGCYRYKCQDGRLMIQANYSLEDDHDSMYMKQYKTCWGNGTVIQISRHQNSGPKGKPRFHKGVILCPPCPELCETGRWGEFKCKRDVWINSTDFAPMPCPGSAGVTIIDADVIETASVLCICTLFIVFLHVINIIS